VDDLCLADSIDAAGSLLEPGGAPGPFEMNDEAAPVLKVQSLSRGVSRKKQ
jgi:hypothetical protein